MVSFVTYYDMVTFLTFYKKLPVSTQFTLFFLSNFWLVTVKGAQSDSGAQGSASSLCRWGKAVDVTWAAARFSHQVSPLFASTGSSCQVAEEVSFVLAVDGKSSYRTYLRDKNDNVFFRNIYLDQNKRWIAKGLLCLSTRIKYIDDGLKAMASSTLFVWIKRVT